MSTLPNAPTYAIPSPLSPLACQQLEQLMGKFSHAYTQMLELCHKHRDALARADHAAIGACVVEQQMAIAQLAQLDNERVRVLQGIVFPHRRAGQRVPVPDVKLAQLAAAASEPMRSKLIRQASELRALMQRCEQQQAGVRAASQSLINHIKSLMHQVSRQMSDTGVYARHATPAAQTSVVSGIDLNC
jgi:hypothetical protein